MPHDPYEYELDAYDDLLTADDLDITDRQRRKRGKESRAGSSTRRRNRLTRSPRTEAGQAFKCGHCKQFIGAPITGGRHRNYCPNCLYSRHVDSKQPGDRRSDCHAMMQLVGLLARRNGEQVVIHRCLGCGKDDPNRIAADDNPVLLMALPPARPSGLALVPTVGTDESEETA